MCDSCEEDSSVSVAYCKDCDDLLCQDCWDIHRKIKLSHAHILQLPLRILKTSQIEQSEVLPLFIILLVKSVPTIKWTLVSIASSVQFLCVVGVVLKSTAITRLQY